MIHSVADVEKVTSPLLLVVDLTAGGGDCVEVTPKKTVGSAPDILFDVLDGMSRRRWCRCAGNSGKVSAPSSGTLCPEPHSGETLLSSVTDRPIANESWENSDGDMRE